MERVGLLAGIGHLPVECAQAARALGYEVYAVALLDGVDPALRENVAGYAEINVAKLGKILDYLKTNHVRKVTAIGKVSKELLMSGHHELPDWRMVKLLLSLVDHKDDTLMLSFINELHKEGIELVDQTLLIRALMPLPGVMTRRAPSENEQRDMEFGFQMAKELGRLDIGQTVVVKGQAVMALEAIEGTDACILRGGELARGGAIVVKVAKPQQDLRFDVPAVGVKTLESMIQVRATALAIEAEQTLLVDRAKTIALAEAHDITIVAMCDPSE